MFAIKKEKALLGATITGLNLSAPFDEALITGLESALATHQVLFFRDQQISHRDHAELGRAFGTLQMHPSYPTIAGFPEIIVLENDRDNPPMIDEWHTDMSFNAVPPLGSILVGRVIPPKGGDTMFCSLADAYDDLSAGTKKTLEDMTATHSFAHGFRESLAKPGGRERLNEAINRNPDVVHPVIRTHPVTGRKMVFLNRTFTRRINELGEQESTHLINKLCDHMVREKYLYRFSWERNSIAFWDNRAVMHVPVNDYWPETRRMERVTINDTLVPV